MRTYIFTIFGAAFVILFVKKIFFIRSFDLKKFSTAKGEMDIEEINKNVFEINGYSLVENSLIPILKKQNPLTCDEVFFEWQKIADTGLTVDPPKDVPNPTKFLLNNYARLSHYYFNQTPKNTNETLENWNQKYIDNLIEIAKINPSYIPHSYNDESLSIHAATKDFDVKGQNGAVIGSQKPWAEVYLLANGAKHVTTVDYYELSIKHPQMDFLYAPNLPSKKQKYYGKFDFIVSFSSIEHSGLGRYGDPIDPIGDIREMNKIHCMLKPKGLLYLGFAVGVDKIAFNAHRIYGRIRLAMLFEGFRLLKTYRLKDTVSEQHMKEVFYDENYELQHLFVLEKKDDKY